jgi:hypothetical protein
VPPPPSNQSLHFLSWFMVAPMLCASILLLFTLFVFGPPDQAKCDDILRDSLCCLSMRATSQWIHHVGEYGWSGSSLCALGSPSVCPGIRIGLSLPTSHLSYYPTYKPNVIHPHLWPLQAVHHPVMLLYKCGQIGIKFRFTNPPFDLG